MRTGTFSRRYVRSRDVPPALESGNAEKPL